MYEGEVVGDLSVLVRELANLEADFSVSFKFTLGKPRCMAYVSVKVENCPPRADPVKLKALLNRSVNALEYPAGWSPSEDLISHYARMTEVARRQAEFETYFPDRRWGRVV